jgi:hypothetical protein
VLARNAHKKLPGRTWPEAGFFLDSLLYNDMVGDAVVAGGEVMAGEMVGGDVVVGEVVGDGVVDDEVVGDGLVGDEVVGDAVLGNDVVVGDEVVGDDVQLLRCGNIHCVVKYSSKSKRNWDSPDLGASFLLKDMLAFLAVGWNRGIGSSSFLKDVLVLTQRKKPGFPG